MFSPLAVGQRWFYDNLSHLGTLVARQGQATKHLRNELELKKRVFGFSCVN